LKKIQTYVALAKTVKKVLLNDLKSRYDTVKLKNLLSKACLLDPRLKALSFLPQEEKDNIIALVEEEAAEMVTVSGEVQSLVDPLLRKLIRERSIVLT